MKFMTEHKMSVSNPLSSEYATQLFATIGKSLYLNSGSADVHFVFETSDERERVPAHKALLIAGSDVFAKMFNGSWKENEEVKITDTSATAFKEFLQFFYFGQVKLKMENISEVMNLGEMYNVAECLALCSKFLKNNLNDENVCRNYELATLFNRDELKRSCEKVIGLNTKAVLKSSGFLTCHQNVLAGILKMNWLSCTEVELFEACMSWVKATAEKDDLKKEIVQTQLGDSFYDIRFGSMSIEEFGALLPANEQFFTTIEYADIIQMITNKDFQPKMFNGNRKKRCDSDVWEMNKLIYCNRLLSSHRLSQPYFIKNLETSTFSSNEPFLLKSFTIGLIHKYFNSNYYKCKDIPTTISIVEMSVPYDSKKEVVKFTRQDKLVSSNREIVELSTPVLIKPGFKYEIRMKQNPPKNYAIGLLLKSEVQMSVGIRIQFHDDPKLPDDSPTGLIISLGICEIAK